ncbi:MFS transporter [Ornithinibacillus halotolerans]|uniref:MFS transporter n=1 Tax=Ornithinibacillus halotolerans TaxID=1274357 RepID=A0A916W6W3_9BACI|nr:MFS transporter [Ornithinibacillus halotolerans]GGA71355.1 MFS transporter [Ornithinibacillus halotolerans]
MSRILFFLIIVSFLDTFIQLPIITPYAMDLGASHILTGVIVAIYSLSNMVGNIFGGHWIDRYGRKSMLFLGMLLVAVILLFYPLAQTGWQLFFIRFVHGLAGGLLIPAAFAYVGDRSKSKTRGKSMALTGASIGIAAITGPAIGGAMAARSQVEYVFIFVSILFFICTFLIYKFIDESYVPTEKGKFTPKEFIPLLKHPLVLQASLAAFALMISNGTLAFALPLKVGEMGLDSETTGMMLSIYGIVAIIVFSTPLNRLYDKFSSVKLVIIGIMIIGSVHIMLNMTALYWLSMLLMVVYGIGFALVFPSMNRIVAEASTKVDRGKAYGIFYAFFSLGSVVGSFVSGATAEKFGLPFLSSAITMISIGIILVVIAKFFTPKIQ